MIGGTGDDSFYTGQSGDSVDGGGGHDVFETVALTGNDTFADSAAVTRILISSTGRPGPARPRRYGISKAA